MHQVLKEILPIQEYDIQMIQLMRLKKERQKELHNLKTIETDLKHKTIIKEGEVIEQKKNARLLEGEVKELVEKLKKLEGQQNQVKKVDEFNALSHEISHINKERTGKELHLSDIYDKIAAEEDLLKGIRESLKTTEESGVVLEEEIKDSINRINEEGQEIKIKRDSLVGDVDPEVFHIYEMLLKNKRDRVIVPIENRCCSGCHIMLTAQHDNLVRKGERLVFCEHCSRTHYWDQPEMEESEEEGAKPRRRRRAAKAEQA